MSIPAHELERRGEHLKAQGESARRPARDPVNGAMVGNWVEAIGDANPIYVDAEAARAAGHPGAVAPPAMIQVWTMQGLRGRRTDDDPLGAMTGILDDAGYTSVVATNCEQTYHRYLRLGEQLSVTSRLEDLVGPKKTALGEGWFFTTRSVWYAGDEPVAEMLFRILKFRPDPAAAAATRSTSEPAVLRPVISRDTAFFWEGTAAGELRVQHCPRCGNLRHPPGPRCPACGHDRPDHIVASGRGSVFSFVVHHHPTVPGKTLPFAVALVELEEGVRMLGQMVDVDPASVEIGMPVEVALTRVDDDLTLPYWRPSPRHRVPSQTTPAQAEEPPTAPSATDGTNITVGTQLPQMRIEATPTFVISTALATRDFQDVHHDRDAAIRRGSKDIFVNILTDTGLVQRFVTEWAGPRALVRSIAIRLGVPCYAYDTLEFSGRVRAVEGDEITVEVVGRGRLGDHVTGTVRLVGVNA